jgi:tetratricopeptide (TPR) repeat protein
MSRFPFRKTAAHGNQRAVELGCLAALLVFSSLCLGATDLLEDNNSLSIKDQEALVIQGVFQYESGDYETAQKTLELMKSANTENAAVPYYLGLIYLEVNRYPDAIAEWRQYIRIAPDGPDSLKIRKYITLLLREEAVAYAKAAVTNEAALMGGPVDDNTVAVTPFNNLGSDTLGLLGKGMAAMLISDLTQVPDLQVVERIRLQALLQEMDLGASGVVDPETVPKVGKLLKSRHVATGSLADPEEGSLQLFSAVVDAKEADRADTREAQGALKEFFSLEKQIACGIIEDIGRDCDEMPGAFNKIHTKSLAALTSFSIGLDYFDQGKFDEARAQFQKAIEEDPEFDLVKDSLLSTPFQEMLPMTASQMVSSLSGEVIAGGGEHPWKSVFRSALGENLRNAVSLAFNIGKNQRACDCLNMALEMGYNPHLVLKTIFEVGNDLEFNPLCECASASGVMKATIARAAGDAVSPANGNIYSISELIRSQCFRGEEGLSYILPETNMEDFPPDPRLTSPPVTSIVP